MEKEFDELTEAGFRRWVLTNFSQLKEHVLTRCKETKNLEKRFDEMLMRIKSLEKTINELMELKYTTRELRKAYTSFDSQIDQAEERISEIEDWRYRPMEQNKGPGGNTTHLQPPDL